MRSGTPFAQIHDSPTFFDASVSRRKLVSPIWPIEFHSPCIGASSRYLVETRHIGQGQSHAKLTPPLRCATPYARIWISASCPPLGLWEFQVADLRRRIGRCDLRGFWYGLLGNSSERRDSESRPPRTQELDFSKFVCASSDCKATIRPMPVCGQLLGTRKTQVRIFQPSFWPSVSLYDLGEVQRC